MNNMKGKYKGYPRKWLDWASDLLIVFVQT